MLNKISSSLLAVSILAFAQPLNSMASDYQETETPELSAKLNYARQYDGILHLAVVLKNDSNSPAKLKNAIDFSKLTIVDAGAGKKYFPLKDADGHYLAGSASDWNDGGRLFVQVPANSQSVLWAFYKGVPINEKGNLSLEIPGMFPFDDMTVEKQAINNKEAGGGLASPMKATLVSATRSANKLNVKFKVNNAGSTKIPSVAINWQEAFAFDNKGQRKYPVLKDSEGLYIAQPRSDNNNGGRWWVTSIASGQTGLASVSFQAPPDDVQMVDIVIPHFEPFLAVPVQGLGGAKTSGIAVSGKTLDLQQAMKDLNAQVSNTEIKVNLAADVLFDFDKAEIKTQAIPVLNKVSTVLNSYPNAQIKIAGHTDGKGNDAYNNDLSKRRAQAIANWLSANAGINSKQMLVSGFGKTKPVAPNTNPNGSDNPAGRAKNRRVEITIQK